jgi:hypothetical protein
LRGVNYSWKSQSKSLYALGIAKPADDLKRVMEFPGYTADNMSRLKAKYAELGAAPSNTRYGWIRTKA